MSEVSKMKPLNGKVITKTIDQSLKKHGTLILVQKESKIKALRGEVIRVAEGSVLEPGDHVWYNNGIGTEIADGKETFLILGENALLSSLAKNDVELQEVEKMEPLPLAA